MAVSLNFTRHKISRTRSISNLSTCKAVNLQSLTYGDTESHHDVSQVSSFGQKNYQAVVVAAASHSQAPMKAVLASLAKSISSIQDGLFLKVQVRSRNNAVPPLRKSLPRAHSFNWG